MPDMMLDPQTIARSVARAMADDPDQVGAFVEAIDMGDGVTDFRFATEYRGYEGWQWSVTLFHDEELDRWTVNESSRAHRSSVASAGMGAVEGSSGTDRSVGDRLDWYRSG